MNNAKIFVSYTLKDGDVSFEILKQLNQILVSKYDVFIDLLHNDSDDPQKRVMDELRKADFIIIIESKATYVSQWVQKELMVARYYKIPMLTIPVSGLYNDECNVISDIISFTKTNAFRRNDSIKCVVNERKIVNED